MTATTGQCKIRPIVWDPQMLLFHVRLCQASGANCTGTHAEAGWDRPASRGTQNIRSAQAICAALSPHIKNPKSGTRMLQFSPPWMESNSSPHSQNVTLPLQRIKSEAQTYNLLPGHSFIQSQQTWQSGWIIQKKKKKKNKERTRLWTVGDASVLTPFQPPPHPSFKPAHRVQTQKWIGSWGKRGVHQSMSNLPSPPPPSIFRPWHFLAPLPPILGYWSQSSELPFGQEAFVSKT